MLLRLWYVSRQWLIFDPWPGNFYKLRMLPKEREMKRKEAGSSHRGSVEINLTGSRHYQEETLPASQTLQDSCCRWGSFLKITWEWGLGSLVRQEGGQTGMVRGF